MKTKHNKESGAHQHKNNTWQDTIKWEKGSTENGAKNSNLTQLINGIYTNQNTSCRMRHIKFSGFWDKNGSPNPDKKIQTLY